jgi:hypothetical protein
MKNITSRMFEIVISCMHQDNRRSRSLETGVVRKEDTHRYPA